MSEGDDNYASNSANYFIQEAPEFNAARYRML